MYTAFGGAVRGPPAKREYANKVPTIPTRWLAAMTERSVLVRGLQTICHLGSLAPCKVLAQARHASAGRRFGDPAKRHSAEGFAAARGIAFAVVEQSPQNAGGPGGERHRGDLEGAAPEDVPHPRIGFGGVARPERKRRESSILVANRVAIIGPTLGVVISRLIVASLLASVKISALSLAISAVRACHWQIRIVSVAITG
jgi:hypothetical protein